MKKIFKFFIILSILLLFGCDDTTMNQKRIIKLEVNTTVVPEFSSNFGTGQYDENSKIYTHEIPYIKDLYINLSYKDLKPVEVYIPSSLMNEEVITKTVDFNLQLDALLNITVDGVKSLEGLEITAPTNYSNFKILNKNSFSISLESRDIDYNIKFKLPDYKEFTIDITKENLISGQYSLNVPAIREDQIYIGFSGIGYNYSIYSSKTNERLMYGYVYNDSKIEYKILPNTEGYYVKIDTSSGEILKNLDINKSIILDYSDHNYKIQYFMNLFEDENECYYDYLLFNKINNTVGHTLYDDPSKYALILLDNTDYRYYDDLSEISKLDNYGYYNVNLNSEYIKINIELIKINKLTNEERIVDDYYISLNNNSEAILDLENNKLTIRSIEYYEENLLIDLYDEKNNFIDTIECYIDRNFGGRIATGQLNYNNKTIVYNVPVFESDLIFDSENNQYQKIKANIDTSLSLIKLFVYQNYMLSEIQAYDNIFLLDENLNVIMPKIIGDYSFYEIKENQKYSFKYYDNEYEFIPTNENIYQGFIIISNTEIPTCKIKVYNDDYSILMYNGGFIELRPDSNNIITLPLISDMNVTYTNGITSKEIFITQNTLELTLYPFIVLEENVIGYDYSYEMDMYYFYYDLSDNYIKSQFYKLDDEYNNIRSDYIIDVNNLVYNEEYKALYYDYKIDLVHYVEFMNFDSYVLITKYNYLELYNEPFLYMFDDAKLEIAGQTVYLNQYDSYYLLVEYDYATNKIIVKEQ